MKTLFLIIAVSVAVNSYSQFSRATLQATGLTCAMCSNAINKSLQKVSFIESVKSDIKNSAFSIVFREGSNVDIDMIRLAVEDAGFSVGGLKLTGTFSGNKIEKDMHTKIGTANFHFLNGEGQLLSGEKEITVVDKNFVTEKQFKKLSAGSNFSCIKTGKTSSCCTKEGMAEGERVYHVTF